MADDSRVSPEEIEMLYERLNEDAEQSGYHLNPDVEFTKELVEGLLVNEKRYGYRSCPCRLASGESADDLDIVCPCDYRDADVTEFDTCYCGLYVSRAVVDDERKVKRIPERRPLPEEREKTPWSERSPALSTLPYPVWRCKVCGYLCARDNPPEVCPICKAKKERFERF